MDTDSVQGTFAIEVIYYTIVFFIKSSIIFMYLRFGTYSLDAFLPGNGQC